MTKPEFVKTVYDAAYKRLKELKKDDREADFYARMLASQACLESDFGTRQTGTYNYFGLKASPEQNGTLVSTHEFSGQERIQIKDRFLNFSSAEDGIRSAVDRLATKFHAFNGKLTPESYVDTIHKYNYFTDDKNSYLNKIKGVLNGSVVPRALVNHKVTVQPMQSGYVIPPQPIPQIYHRNDATRVAKPLIPPRLRNGGLFTWQQVKWVKEFLRSYKKSR